jgi:CHAT domain-containing protein
MGAVAGAVRAGTPAEVLAFLPGPGSSPVGLIHLACHASAGASSNTSSLLLATGQDVGTTDPVPPSGHRLRVAEILRRAHDRTADHDIVLVLSACTSDVSVDVHDEALTLATAFLTAGATTVVGSLWAVPDDVTPVLMYVFHHHLAVDRLPPADALRAAQLWMLDPNREPPPGMPADLIRIAGSANLAAVEAWAAFAHHGR